ncbi:Cupin domain protein [Candidatus Izimaplasma bacterium HR1]|jgi:mannose-6-phosphate isomerase-like protein (cupin superfamily)|uniref:cupin domain-containing protein n=1 Tax=Candidatus Izimoplasma sp. HR1 TaxID=1541959 RepID=UPI0004F8ADD3|nr:Cupin domain protein [Candidatus Izimaplasma bacterium HR1]
MNKKNITKEFDKITDFWSPSIVAEVNDSYMKVAKISGDLVWHTHENEDELFIVIKGTMIIEYKDSEVLLEEGDFHVVKKGIAHFPKTTEECWVVLFENKTTLHTGEVVQNYTKSVDEQLK